VEVDMKQLVVEKDVRIAMRDGVPLTADVWRPVADSTVPALVQRTPYNKEMSASPEVMRLTRAGYAVVVQDVRGRYASGGVFDPFRQEASDGEDTIGWAAAQPWCSGDVGMLGPSYLGAAQLLAAARQPARLKAIAPSITASDYHEGWTYQGGALQLGFIVTWATMILGLGDVAARLGRGEAQPADIGAVVAASDRLGDLFRHSPTDSLSHLDEIAPYWRDWLGHPAYDAFWRSLAPRERYADVTVPALNIGGWYDLFLSGTLENYRGLRAHGTGAARESRLIVGPWAHANMTADFPERAYGMGGGALLSDLTGRQIRWFDRHVRGIDNGLDAEAPGRVFVMGANTWRDAEDWPLPESHVTPLYLHSSGAANTAAGDGILSFDAPAGEQPSDTYRYDPSDPVPTVGGATFLPGLTIGANAGPRDQRAVEARDDVLCFTTTPLEEELTVIGPIELVLHASSSARDTDFTAKLVDVHPDGRAEILCDGILRGRYRVSLSDPRPMEPDRPYALRIDVGATANVFAAGHRIRLEISSSNFPRFDRNTNTGGTIAAESESDYLVATNRVFHDAGRPSHLLLPLV
jgi:putative CocE/NonD family hydrolase